MLLQTCHSLVIFVNIAMYLLSTFHAGSVSAFKRNDQLQEGPTVTDIFQESPDAPEMSFFPEVPGASDLSPEGTGAPDIIQEGQVGPDIFQGGQIVSDIFQDGPVAPDIFGESPSAPDIFGESPRAPDIFGPDTKPHKSPFQELVDEYSTNRDLQRFKEFVKHNSVLNVDKNQVASYGNPYSMWEDLRKEGEKLNGNPRFDTAYRTTTPPVSTTRMPKYLNSPDEFSLDFLSLILSHKKNVKPLQGNRRPPNSDKWLPEAPFDDYWFNLENQDPADMNTMISEYLQNQETYSKFPFSPFDFPHRKQIARPSQTKFNKIIANNKVSAERLREKLKFWTRKNGNFGAGLKDHLFRYERPLFQGSAYMWPKLDRAVFGKPGARINNAYGTMNLNKILKLLQDIYSISFDLGQLFSEVIFGSPFYRYEMQAVRPEVTMKDFIRPFETSKLQTANNVNNKEVQNAILRILQENLNYQNGVGPDPLATSDEGIDLLLQALQK